ncbi:MULTISPECIES: hypothetical protein [Rhodopseudomonas]|uniref:Membrane protein n=1 Tax=Rhodopseudomonas palustris TaxID=1076 RepID=A0A0D7EVJ6_RHOPL|nr:MULTISPECIES: hypothetical protein [Rhodopseudomonas]KIZ43462.1 membrane protein [Rhodopseudomonas palustris]MDF3809203.1 hypothetical protein [Rhodopseudomonas sp. BAL398]WOK20616.1 hypothetical protein RBJ75_06215 [Rhodopseudomonas sp. BAL398]
MKVTISRLFDNVVDAQHAIFRLEQAGVDEADISLVANNSEKYFAPDYGSAAGKGAAVGAAFGGFGGMLAGLGMLLVPGFEAVVEAGWFAAAATGALVVGVAGGLIGIVAEAGIATNQAEICAKSIRRGGSLVSVRVERSDRRRYEAVLDPAAEKSKGRDGDAPATPDSSQARKEREPSLR